MCVPAKVAEYQWHVYVDDDTCGLLPKHLIRYLTLAETRGPPLTIEDLEEIWAETSRGVQTESDFSNDAALLAKGTRAALELCCH